VTAGQRSKAARIHHPRRHAAVRTGDYVFSQLIPYLGNKRKLLHLIAEGLAGTGLRRGTFVDLFTGSTVVARFAKRAGWRVVANDWEPFSHQIALGTIVPNRVPPFRRLGGAAAVFERLNRLPPVDGWVARHLCPADDARPDPDRERMFFTRTNGRRIDAIGDRIASWWKDGVIDDVERAYVLSALVYATSYASNTSGVFKGFHRGWGGSTSTALYRILARLKLAPPVVFDNGFSNVAVRSDAQTLASTLRDAAGCRPEVVYLDPPYNQHPYGSNYHVLNTVVLWDEPPVSPAIRPEARNKSAIRTDWRTERRSRFNHAALAPKALAELLAALDARFALLSYSTDGNIPLETFFQILARRGRVRIVSERYKRYRVSTPRMSPRPHNVELVALVDLDRRGSRNSVDSLVAEVRQAEAGG
jgi:adenine-specific DNA-methyltransferase